MNSRIRNILKSKLYIALINLLFLLVLPNELKADCSFWAAISAKVPSDVIRDQLFNLSNSLMYQAKANSDGWGIGYYDKEGVICLKGISSADQDKEYASSVEAVAQFEPEIIVAHVRKATSGCQGDVPNPHPFKRDKNGKHWLFGHNGTLDKNLLLGLIGTDYFNENLPNTCTYDPPDSWVDSELYFIFLLKHIENNNWDVEKGIKTAITELETLISGSEEGLNFFLTDGATLWAFRKGRPLYFYYQSAPEYSIVASVIPSSDNRGWAEVPEDTMLVMKAETSPVLISIAVPVASTNEVGEISPKLILSFGGQ